LLSPANRGSRAVGDRPAGEVDRATDRIDADHLGTELGHRHAAKRRRDKGRKFDDAQVLKQPVHGAVFLASRVAIEPQAGEPRNRSSAARLRHHTASTTAPTPNVFIK